MVIVIQQASRLLAASIRLGVNLKPCRRKIRAENLILRVIYLRGVSIPQVTDPSSSDPHLFDCNPYRVLGASASGDSEAMNI